LFKNFLVVCTGNICRSPMMEGFLRQRLGHLPDLRIESGGTAAVVNNPAEPFALQVMEQRGIDISSHRARQVDADILYRADLIFVMDRTHLRWIDARVPAARGRVFLAGHWRKGAEVEDPFMTARENFETAAAQLEGFVDDWLTRLGLSSAPAGEQVSPAGNKG
jgi:protein-tyrosine phosphatase